MKPQAEIKASKPVATSPRAERRERAEARKARRRTANNSSVVFSFVPLRNDWPDDSEQFPNGVLKWGRILNETKHLTHWLVIGRTNLGGSTVVILFTTIFDGQSFKFRLNMSKLCATKDTSVLEGGKIMSSSPNTCAPSIFLW
jgi:hypothetical protein